MAVAKYNSFTPASKTLEKLIVSQVENGCIIWMPTSNNSVNLNGSIQRRFTKMIDYFQSYDDNLQP